MSDASLNDLWRKWWGKPVVILFVVLVGLIRHWWNWLMVFFAHP
jgi:hypothetical protein